MQPVALGTHFILIFSYLISLLVICLGLIATGYVFLILLPEPKYFTLRKSYCSWLVDRYLKSSMSIENEKRNASVCKKYHFFG